MHHEMVTSGAWGEIQRHLTRYGTLDLHTLFGNGLTVSLQVLWGLHSRFVAVMTWGTRIQRRRRSSGGGEGKVLKGRVQR